MNAIIATIATLLSLIFQQCYIARAKGPVTYIVGDDLGWTLDGYPESWTGGKKFYAGDILGMYVRCVWKCDGVYNLKCFLFKNILK